MPNSSLLYVGIRGTVLALDRATGQLVWDAKLKGGDFVYVTLQDDALYATSRGEIFCLDPATGQLRWHNPLKGYGLGFMSVASGDNGQTLLAKARRQEDLERQSAT
jgi:outer membrane protein assembly factor BamB